MSDSLKILMISYTSFLQKFYQSLPGEIAMQSDAQVKVLVSEYWKELWSGGKIYLEKTSDPNYEIFTYLYNNSNNFLNSISIFI